MLSLIKIKIFLNFLIKNLYIFQKNNKASFDSKNFKKIYKYIDQIQSIVNKEKKNFEFFLDDLLIFGPTILIKIILSNTKRFVKTLKDIIDNIILEKIPFVIYENKDIIESNVIVIKEHNKKLENSNKKKLNELNFPFYQIILIPFRSQKMISLISIKAHFIGKFISLEGLVVEINKVDYLLKKAVYFCKTCKSQVVQSVNSHYFKPFVNCPIKKCRFIKNTENFYLCIKLSLFEQIQELKIRNSSEKNLEYNYSQNLIVRLNGNLTNTCKLGDLIKVAGILLPFNDFNNRLATGEEIFLKSFYIDKSVIQKFGCYQKNFLEKEISNIFSNTEIYEKISSYLDIFIIGQEDFKKGLLLSLIGSNVQMTSLDSKLNDIINIFIILESKFISTNISRLISALSPRYIYNDSLLDNSLHLNIDAFKKSDPLENNSKFKFSENGITYIDNFNKKSLNLILKLTNNEILKCSYKTYNMELKPKTTIIAVSRKNNFKKKSYQKNFNATLFLNFDLFFCLSNFLNSSFDLNTAQHIINQYKLSESFKIQEISTKLKVVRALIIESQKILPFIPDDVFSYLTYCYVSTKTKIIEKKRNIVALITLNSAIKISKSLARLKFQDRVYIIDIKEAFRLLKEKKNILIFEKTLNIQKKIENKIFKIILKEFIESKTQFISIMEIEKKILSAGFNCESLVKCISFYEEINQFRVDITRGQLLFLSQMN